MKLSSLTLSDRARRKLVELSGPCYCEDTDTIRLVGKTYKTIGRYNSNMFYLSTCTCTYTCAEVELHVEIHVHVHLLCLDLNR